MQSRIINFIRNIFTGRKEKTVDPVQDPQKAAKEMTRNNSKWRDLVLSGQIIFIGCYLLETMTESEIMEALHIISAVVGERYYNQEQEALKHYTSKELCRHFLDVYYGEPTQVKKILEALEKTAGKEKAANNMLYCIAEIDLNGICYESPLSWQYKMYWG